MISYQRTQRDVARLKTSCAQRHNCNPDDEKVVESVTESLIRRYTAEAALLGGMLGAPGILPGPGAFAVVGATAIEWVVMRLHLAELAMAVAAACGEDISDKEVRRLCSEFVGQYDIGKEKSGKRAIADAVSEEAIKFIACDLKGASLRTIRGIFRKAGLRFTRKGFLRCIPGGIGVALGAAVDGRAMWTMGHDAKRHFGRAS